MRTQCPHCQAKFNASDEHEGMKVKCPKCKQAFVISSFEEHTDVELCTSCGRKIGKLEQACVFEGKVVCRKCDQKLRTAPKDLMAQPSDEVTKTSVGGLIVALIWIGFWGFGWLLLLIDRDRYTGALVSQARMKAFEFSAMFAILGPGICLMLRSFFPGLGFWRGVLTFLGGFLVGFAVLMLVMGGVAVGSPSQIGFAVFTFIVPLVPGVILLIFGFRPKKHFRATPGRHKP